MKAHIISLVLAVSALASCAHDTGRIYAGSPGSAYDQGSNPARADGVVTYDPTTNAKSRDFGNSGDGFSARAVH
jgi:hypothetical protein